MSIRLLVQIILLVMLGCISARHLYFGKYGIQAYRALSVEVSQLKKQHIELTNTLQEKKQLLHLWQTEPFFKEKLAREDLLYSYTHEYVYMIPEAST